MKPQPTDQSLRQTVRTWLADNIPADWRERFRDSSEDEFIRFQMEWMRKLADVGYAVPTIARHYGGAGLSFDDQIVLIEEMARADAPPLDMYMVTQTHAPVTILTWGTEEQKHRFLPGIAAGDLWCQGFSEPNAGSDLAALRTGAIADGDEFVITGQKIWSSFSRHARYCLLLVRTDPDAAKRDGISYFVLDMQTPGVEVRPIRQATGNAEFCEIFLNEVRVPATDLIGPLNEGWRVAQSTLAAERGLNAFERVERLWYNFDRYFRRVAQTRPQWLSDPQKLRKMASIVADLQAVRQLIRDLLSDPSEERAATYAPVIKISSTEIAQEFADFAISVGGPEAQMAAPGYEQDFRVPLFDYIFTFGNTISAGANEIMRNIISERLLGMPR